MSDPVPIILCGGSPVIAAGVKASLHPECEGKLEASLSSLQHSDQIIIVIHVILSTAAGVSEIPVILEGATPPASEPENVGTKNYSKKPIAVVTGAGYEDEDIEKLQEACKGKRSVSWLRPDTTIPAPPLGPEYAKAVVLRVKATMKELVESGKLGEDKVFWY
jgi:hypothetical protein